MRRAKAWVARSIAALPAAAGRGRVDEQQPGAAGLGDQLLQAGRDGGGDLGRRFALRRARVPGGGEELQEGLVERG